MDENVIIFILWLPESYGTINRNEMNKMQKNQNDKSYKRVPVSYTHLYRVILYFQPCRPIDHQLFQIWAQVAFLTDELVVGTDVHSDQTSACLIRCV